MMIYFFNSHHKMKKQGGYSLVELMVTVAVIGIVASVSLGSYTRTISGMKANLAKNQMQGFAKHFRADSVEGRTLSQISGSLCSACSMTTGLGAWGGRMDFTNGYDQAASDAAWRRLGFEKTPLDPWNRPFILDENEGEFDSILVGAIDCRFDVMISAGPDGIFEGSGDGDDVFGDDILYRMPYVINRPSCTGSLTGQFGGPSGF